MLSYGSGSDTLLGGVHYQPLHGFRMKLDLTWVQSDASFDQFDFTVPPERVTANQSWDFTQTYRNSDLDLTRVEAALGIDYRFQNRWWLYGTYRYVDVQDDAPYRGDVDGTIDFYSIGAGITF